MNAVQMMKKLNQQAAGWLIGVPVRTLRDWPEAPRCSDGTYDAAALVAWNRNTIAAKDWVRFSGRSAREVREHGDFFRLPITGMWVDLPAMVKGLHDALAQARAVQGAGVDDPLMVGDATPGLERYRQAKATLAEMDVQARSGELIRRDHIHELLGQMAGILRQAGQTLQRSYGADAQLVLDGAIDDIVATAQRIGTEQVQALPVEGVAADAGGT